MQESKWPVGMPSLSVPATSSASRWHSCSCSATPRHRCHAKACDLAQFTILDDILVAAAGCPNLIVGPMVKTGAFVIPQLRCLSVVIWHSRLIAPATSVSSMIFAVMGDPAGRSHNRAMAVAFRIQAIGLARIMLKGPFRLSAGSGKSGSERCAAKPSRVRVARLFDSLNS